MALRKTSLFDSIPLNDNQAQAAALLSRKRGASLEDLTARLGVEGTAARAIIGRLRAKGAEVEITGPSRWRLVDGGWRK